MTTRDSSSVRDLLPGPADALSLDFANTRYWRGRESPVETLTNIGAVFDWVQASQASSPAVWSHMRRRVAAEPSSGEGLHTRVLAVREAIYAVFAAGADGAAPASRDLARINTALADVPARTRLVADADGPMRWRLAGGEPQLSTLLAGVLWSAGDLLSGPRRARVRRCANPECLWLFLDDSKSANRRWCQMSACGNRAKAQRFYARHKADKAGA